MDEKIMTTLGEIQGFMGSKGIHTFLGISYGAGTTGTRRFRKPVPAEPWTGVREERLAWEGIPVKLPWEGKVFVTAMRGK